MQRAVESNKKGYKGLGMEGPVARWYAKIVQKDIDEYRRDARLVAEQLPAGARVLDLATGPGHLAIELAKLGRFEVVGLDISTTFVRIAKQKASQAGVAVDFQLGDASRMPFDDESFDFVVCRAAFKNFADPIAVLEDIHRVLKRGGRALVLDLRQDAPLAAIEERVRAMGLNPLNAFMTRNIFKHMLLKRAYGKAGFERLAAVSPFSSWDLRDNALEIHAWFSKGGQAEPAATGS